MSSRGHFTPDRISRYFDLPVSLEPGERLELICHLSASCERCWSAVPDLGPGSRQICSDPLVEALWHVGTPSSRALLGADHLTAIAEVRQRPFGFAFLLLEEASSLAQSCENPEHLDEAFELIGTRPPRRHLWPITLEYA